MTGMCCVRLYLCNLNGNMVPTITQSVEKAADAHLLLTLLYIYVAFVQCPFTLTLNVPAFLWSIFCPLKFTDRVRVLTV